jgi:WD40 repeat protein/serine/threonine protein kinase
MAAPVADIKSIFGKALELRSAIERAAYLEQACQGDLRLRAEVESLLQAGQEAANFLAGPGSVPQTTLEEPVAERPGTVIGPYKLLERIGEGGFGVVFMAEQAQPLRRKVALKVLKPGMDTRQVVARFEAERQALAIMDHPNIAKVFDGGATATGRPYFVMELVRGVPITEFCDQNHFTPRQRLELFVAVCQAVQHAHQKGVIHRDLKPSNVLVSRHDTTPVVKVIDFGVAKALGQTLTDKTLFTGFAQMVGTPLYMSPEQAGMSDLDVDTRSDVYSLGVLLYELLTGTTPFAQERFKNAGYDEIRRIIREEEPARPSTRLSTLGPAAVTVSANRESDPRALSRLLRGELDWVVMKALEKDRNRRYETASAFAADVQRYLHDEPVLACPPTVGYRLGKFLRRNRRSVLAAGLGFFAVLGGGIGVAFGLTEAWKQRELTSLWQQAVAARGEAETARDGETKAREKFAAFEYGRTMQVAHQEWRENNVSAALALLDSTRAEFRGWEWHYLHRLCHADLLALPIDFDPVFAVSADGSRVLTGAPDLSGVVRDARTGAVLLTLHELPTANGRPLAKSNQPTGCSTTSASFSKDGSRVLTSGDEAVIWDARTGAILLTITAQKKGSGWSARFNPDESRVLTCGDTTPRVWDARTGAELLALKGHTESVRSASFSPDGSRVVTASQDATARVWDAKSGAEVLAIKGHTAAVMSASFSPDGSRIITASWDGTARAWDAASGAEVLALKGHTSWVNSASFSPDGLRVVTAGRDRTARIWDARTGAEVLTLKGHTAEVMSASFSADGSRVWTASRDGTARAWDARTETEVLTLRGHMPNAASASFSPDGSRLVTGSGDGTAKVWDAGTGAELLALKGHTSWINLAWFSPDGSRVLTGSLDNTARVWDARTGAEVSTLKGHTDRVCSASFSADGLRIVTASNDHTARVWDARTGAEVLTLKGHTSFVDSASFSPDGSQIVTASWDETARVWDARTGAEVLTLKGHTAVVPTASFSPNGLRVLTASRNHDRTARVWDARTGAEVLTLKGHTGDVTTASWSADGSRVLTASGDGIVRVWDARTGAEVLTLKGHTSVVRSASFSPDGLRVLTGSLDNTARVWDARTGAEVLTLKGHTGDLRTASWSADGSRVLTCGDTTAKVWDASPVAQAKGAVTGQP